MTEVQAAGQHASTTTTTAQEQVPSSSIRDAGPTWADEKNWNERCVQGWIEDARARGLSPQTIDNYHHQLKAFLKWLGPASLLEVGHNKLKAFFDPTEGTRAVSEKSIGPCSSALSSLYDYLAAERLADVNLVPSFRRRYLTLRLREQSKRRFERRPCLTVREMRRLVRSLSDTQERLLVVLAAKTGLRSREIVAIDVADIDWQAQSIALKPNRKRTHLIAFFDAETALLLRKWLKVRALWTKDALGPLFLGDSGRMASQQAGYIAVRAARRLGFHKAGGESRERFTLHACRHWFTTHLRRGGMVREHIKVLRGDALPDTMDLYLHIDYAALRAEYLRCIPRLTNGPMPPPEKARERTARNPSFGGLTPLEASHTRGHRPQEITLQLRRLIADDLIAGRLERPKQYALWMQAKTDRSLGTARQAVSKQMRILGIPSLQQGPRGRGWKAMRQELRGIAPSARRRKGR